MSWELDEACMRALGWEYRPRFIGDTAGYWRSANGEQVVCEERPLFSTNLTDARLLEDEIERRGLQAEYMHSLIYAMSIDPDDTFWIDPSGTQVWALFRATPEQRARAFLEAITA